jgi:cytidine deaminase
MVLFCAGSAGGRDAACGEDIAVEDEFSARGGINHATVAGVQGVATAVALACGGNGCATPSVITPRDQAYIPCGACAELLVFSLLLTAMVTLSPRFTAPVYA